MAVTIITIKPVGGGKWEVFETPGVQPCFGNLRLAIDYAKTRANFRAGEIQVLDNEGRVTRVIAFDETERRM